MCILLAAIFAQFCQVIASYLALCQMLVCTPGTVDRDRDDGGDPLAVLHYPPGAAVLPGCVRGDVAGGGVVGGGDGQV